MKGRPTVVGICCKKKPVDSFHSAAARIIKRKQKRTWETMKNIPLIFCVFVITLQCSKSVVERFIFPPAVIRLRPSIDSLFYFFQYSCDVFGSILQLFPCFKSNTCMRHEKSGHPEFIQASLENIVSNAPPLLYKKGRDDTKTTVFNNSMPAFMLHRSYV